jgi:hypothetical protein
MKQSHEPVYGANHAYSDFRTYNLPQATSMSVNSGGIGYENVEVPSLVTTQQPVTYTATATVTATATANYNPRPTGLEGSYL